MFIFIDDSGAKAPCSVAMHQHLNFARIARLCTEIRQLMKLMPGPLVMSKGPRQYSAIGTDYIKAIARQHGQWLSRTVAHSLEAHFPDKAVSDRTVCRMLHRDLNFKFGKLWRKVKLTEIHKHIRVVWSLLHSENGWQRMIFFFIRVVFCPLAE